MNFIFMTIGFLTFIIILIVGFIVLLIMEIYQKIVDWWDNAFNFKV